MQALAAVNVMVALVALLIWLSPEWMEDISEYLARRAYGLRQARRAYLQGVADVRAHQERYR